MEYNALKKALLQMKFSFDDIDSIFWHRTYVEFISNIMKSTMFPWKRINCIRMFLREPYPAKLLAKPVKKGEKGRIRAWMIRHRLNFSLAVLEYVKVSIKNKLQKIFMRKLLNYS